jgi:hypothetical protein
LSIHGVRSKGTGKNWWEAIFVRPEGIEICEKTPMKWMGVPSRRTTEWGQKRCCRQRETGKDGKRDWAGKKQPPKEAPQDQTQVISEMQKILHRAGNTEWM